MRTSSIYKSAALMCIGIEPILVEFDPDERVTVFTFEDTDEVLAAERDYRYGLLTVVARDFAQHAADTFRVVKEAGRAGGAA